MPIRLRDVSKIYNQNTPFEVRAVDGVSLDIEVGERIGLVGPTGCGKSTLAQIIAGLLVPTTGYVEITQEAAAVVQAPRLPSTSLNNGKRLLVGMVFQSPEDQFFKPTVFEEIAFGPRTQGLKHELLVERVRESMHAVGLEYELFKELSPFSLSRGEQRRVGIASILAMRPHFLILDEPVADLDSETQKRVLHYVRRGTLCRGLTTIVITHHLDYLLGWAGRILVMCGGRLLFDGPPERVFSDPAKLDQAGLQLPQLAEVVYLLRQKGLVFSTDELLTENWVIQQIVAACPCALGAPSRKGGA